MVVIALLIAKLISVNEAWNFAKWRSKDTSSVPCCFPLVKPKALIPSPRIDHLCPLQTLLHLIISHVTYFNN